MLQFLIDNKVLLLSLALSLSEVLALIPNLKANGILQGLIDLLKKNQVK